VVIKKLKNKTRKETKMKQLMSVIILLAFTFLYLGCNESPQNIISANADKGGIVPFKGDINGVAISIGGGPGPFDPIKKLNTFSGNASHTGKFNCELKYWIQLTSLSGGVLYGIEGIDGILTAANGDKIWFENTSGAWTFRNGNPFEPGMVDGTIHANVVGGTGRFSGATGYIDAVVVQEYDPLADPTPTTGNWTGKIKY
jgi:hypothetical protein